jgi:predicted small lipoprotein YifL
MTSNFDARRFSSLLIPTSLHACAFAAAALALSACGLRGDLERPMPMWGNPPRVDADDPRTLKENEERAAAEKARIEAEREAARQAEIEELRRAAEGTPPPP